MKSLLPLIKSTIGVGLLTIAALAALVYVSIRLTTNQLGGSDGTYSLYVLLQDASGLIEGTAVRSAGIKIGIIDSIELENRLARIEMRIRDTVPIYSNAVLSVRSLGILGDKFISIDQGSANSEQLVDGDRINIFNRSGNIDQIVTNLDLILQDVQSVTGSLANSLGSTAGESRINQILEDISAITAALNSTTQSIESRIAGITDDLAQTLRNSGEMSADLRSLVADNRALLDNIFANLSSISEELAGSLPQLSENLNGMVGENRQNIKQSLDNLQIASESLKEGLDNLNLTADKIASGEGTIGKLVSDENMASTVEETIDGLGRFLGEANRLKLDIGFRAEYQSRSHETKGYLNLFYIPRRDRYFLFQVVNNPGGQVSEKTEDVTTTDANGTNNRTTVTRTTEDSYLLSLQIAQKYYDTRVRFGLFEGSVGFGIDQYFGNFDQYQLSFEGWDFDRDDQGAHLKLAGSWNFLGNAYLIGGFDDFSNEIEDNRQPFIGIGLDFNEDSLKLISSGSAITGLVAN